MEANYSKTYGTKLFAHKNDKAIFLFLGLALWFVIPILGIFPLLFFVHLNQKPKSKLNAVVTLLIVLTITIFVSSADIISDLAVYVDNYNNLAKETPFEASGVGGLEFLLWLVSYPVHHISGGSNYACVFFWSFLFNFLTFFVIARGFSPRNYGLLLLFIVSNPIYIGFQCFFVRQYFSTLLLLVAIAYMERKLVMWGIFFISNFAHLANLMYLPMMLLYDKVRILGNKVVLMLMVVLGAALPFSDTLFVNLAEQVAGLIPAEYSMVILGKTAYYAKERANEQSFIVPLLEHSFIFIIILFLIKNLKFKSDKEKLIYFMYPIFFILMYLGKDIHLFSNRVAFILFPFGGLFYWIAIERDWKIFKMPIITTILVFKLLYFNYYLYTIELGEREFHFLDDRVYSSTIIDYVQIAHHNFINDVKIKEKPDRGF